MGRKATLFARAYLTSFPRDFSILRRLFECSNLLFFNTLRSIIALSCGIAENQGLLPAQSSVPTGSVEVCKIEGEPVLEGGNNSNVIEIGTRAGR